MWIFLNNGYFSIVENSNNPTQLIVRARFKHDLESTFGEHGEISETPEKNYRFRMILDRSVVSEILKQKIEEIDYGSFRNSINPSDQGRIEAYSKVWKDTYYFQEKFLNAEPKIIQNCLLLYGRNKSLREVDKFFDRVYRGTNYGDVHFRMRAEIRKKYFPDLTVDSILQKTIEMYNGQCDSTWLCISEFVVDETPFTDKELYEWKDRFEEAVNNGPNPPEPGYWDYH